MEELVIADIQRPEYFNQGNGQELREKLIRLSVKYCENYATDILILFESINMEKDFELEIGFRQFGVDWGVFQTTKYRYYAKISKVGRKVSLSGRIGEV